MNLSHDEEQQVRVYLFNDLARERARELEERLLRDDEFVEQVQLVEDEIIEDYVRGTLTSREASRFKGHFLSTPRRRRKLMVIEGLRKTAIAGHGDIFKELAADAPPRPSWLKSLFTTRWKVAVFAVVVLIACAVVWRAFLFHSDVEKGLVALNKAYRERRPLQARITGLSYAPFTVTLGDKKDGVDERARDLSASLLQNAANEDPSPATLHALGLSYLTNKEFDKAILQFQEALKTAPDDAQLHADLGAALFEKGKLERLSDQSGRSETTLAESLRQLDRALELNDSLLEARFNRALLYQALHLPQRAQDDWGQYITRDPSSQWADEARRQLEQIKEQGNKVSRREPDLLQDFQQAYQSGDQEQVWRVFSKSHLRTGNALTSVLADEYLNFATKGHNEEADKRMQALTYLGQLSEQRADDYFTSQLVHSYKSRSSDDIGTLLHARKLMRDAYEVYNQSRNDRAVELYTQAKTLFGRLGDPPEALLAAYWIGHCYFQQPDVQRSIVTFTDVAVECNTKKYRWLQAITLNGLANVRARALHYSQAVDDGRESYRLSAQIGDENGVLRGLNTLASLYRNLGRYQQSLRLASEGFDLAGKIAADASQVIGLYATSAWDFNSVGHYGAALEYEREALRLAGEMNNNPLVLSRYRVQMGLIYAKLKNYDEAVRNIRSGLEIGQGVKPDKIGDEMTTYALLYLGRTEREAGAFPEALADITRVIEFCGEKNEVWLLHEARKEQLLTHIAQGDVATASEELPSVILAYEEQRKEIWEESNRNSFFEKEQDIYDVAIDFTYTRIGSAEQSFEYSEASRARSLLDASVGGWSLPDGTDATDLRFPGASRPIPLSEIRERLPAQTQVLQYAVLKDKLIIWYVSKDKFDSRIVNISTEDLTNKVDRFLGLMSKPPSGDDPQQMSDASAELYEILIRPVLPLLDGGKQLCVVPDKALSLLPFGALFSPATQTYFVEAFSLVYAQSSNVLVHDTELARQKAGARSEKLLSVGNPLFDRDAFPNLDDLPSAAKEASDIAPFYDSFPPLTGRDATKAAVVKQMRRADVFNFATHYLPDPDSPMLSKLLLARPAERVSANRQLDSALYAYEIYRLRPDHPRLVVLSACQSGVEGYVKGEGALGFSRPFQAAGVPLVVASLWPVESEATAELMIDFHRLRKLNGLPTTEALRQAQARMLQNPSHRYPYYWASFVVIGGYGDY